MGFIDKILKRNSQEPPRTLLDNRDVYYLVSYPKSGNTWMRFLVGNYLTNGQVNFSNYHKVIPDIHRNPQDIGDVQYSPVFVKSHFAYTSEYRKIVYIYRDGRDVSLSYYHHLLGKNRIPANSTFHDFFWKFFITGKVFFGDWGEHVKSWKKPYYVDQKIMFLSYESLQNDTAAALRQVLQFGNIEIDDVVLTNAVKNSTKESMLKDEKENRKASLEHKDVVSEDFKFVRKGLVGEWRSEYDAKMLEAFNEKYSDLMKELGYEIAES